MINCNNDLCSQKRTQMYQCSADYWVPAIVWCSYSFCYITHTFIYFNCSVNETLTQLLHLYCQKDFYRFLPTQIILYLCISWTETCTLIVFHTFNDKSSRKYLLFLPQQQVQKSSKIPFSGVCTCVCELQNYTALTSLCCSV